MTYLDGVWIAIIALAVIVVARGMFRFVIEEYE